MDNTKVKVYQVVESILYRLKTGYYRRQLPMKQFFRVKYHWQSVYYHFQKWCKDGSWEQVWKYVLEKYKDLLDMSSVHRWHTYTQLKGRTGSGLPRQEKARPATCLS
ncbi:MAG: transposase [Bacteroidales bacterium]